MNEVITNLTEAIIQNRIDILKLTFAKARQENSEFPLSDLLSCDNNEKGTLLHFACQSGKVDAVRTLLQEGADPLLKNSKNQFALELAKSEVVQAAFVQDAVQSICSDNLDRLKRLLESGVPVNSVDSERSKNSLLHWAACYAGINLLRELMSRGAEANSKNSCGVTPLHEAVQRGDLRLVEELLNFGADCHIEATSGRNAGKSALDLATNSPSMLQLLDHPDQFLLNGYKDEAETTFSEGALVLGNSSYGMNRQHRVSESTVHSEQLEEDHNSSGTMKLGLRPVHFKSVIETSDNPLHMSTGIPNPSSHLWPKPQKLTISEQEDRLFISNPMLISMFKPENEALSANGNGAMHVCRLLIDELSVLGKDVLFDVTGRNQPLENSQISLELGHIVANGRKDSYQILVHRDRVRVMSNDVRGLFYGCMTLLQLLHLYQLDGLPQMKLVDWPDLPTRAVLLDVSRGHALLPVILHDLIRHLSKLKINQVQIFCHLSPGVQHPYTSSELRALCRHSASWFVEPVLAIDTNTEIENLSDVDDCVDRLLHSFPSDCPLHLGPRLSARLLDRVGGSVQFEWPINWWVEGRRVQVCGEQVAELVEEEEEMRLGGRSTLLPVEYGSAATERCTALDAVGIPFILSPSTQSWSALTACAQNRVEALQEEIDVVCPQSDCCVGLLSAEWSGPPGLLTHHVFSLPSHLLITGRAWNLAAQLPAATSLYQVMCDVQNTHIFFQHPIAAVVRELGEIESLVCQQLPAEKESPLLSILYRPRQFLQRDIQLITNVDFGVPLKRLRMLHRNSAAHSDHRLAALCRYVLTCAQIACRILHSVSTSSTPSSVCNGAVGDEAVSLTRLPRTVRTDLANKLLQLSEEAKHVWTDWYKQELTTHSFGDLTSLLLKDTEVS